MVDIRSSIVCLIIVGAAFLASCSGGGSSNQRPVAVFSVSTSIGLAPMDVTFDASASFDTDGTIAEYDWDFGDGQTGSGAGVTHTYTNADTYTVILTVTDNLGAWGTQQTNVTSTIGIGGTIQAATGSAIDSDVNDPFAPFAANNDFNTAQNIPNPVVLGGFATNVATGDPNDRFASTNDRYDVYRISLAADQSINLYISDYVASTPGAKDLDLRLYDVDDTTVAVAESTGTTSIESVTVPANGEYFIEVEAVAGDTNYIMTIGQTISMVSTTDLNVDDDFVPGEILVSLNDNVSAMTTSVAMDSYLDSMGLVRTGDNHGQPMLVKLGDVVQRAKTATVLGIQQSAVRDFMNDEMRMKQDTIEVVRALRKRPDVISADLNYIRRLHALPNDSDYPKQWNYPLINLPQAWDITQGSTSVIVAVVDTGVFTSHVDLTSNLVNGYDFISNPAFSNDGDGIDANPDDPGDSSNPVLSSFHGTHIAGTVAANTNNSTGVAGSGWSTKIMPIRVLGLGGTGTSNDIIQGLRYAAGLSNSSGTVPAQHADIINMSFGGGGFSQSEQNAITAVRGAGVIIVASAGNDDSSTPIYPASYTGVISVSAVDKNKHRAPYSNHGFTIDVAAPGGDMSTGFQDGILSTFANNSSGTRVSSYTYYQGTSMATPHVAGIIALMKAVYPGLTPAIFDSLLTSGALTEDLANNGIATRDDDFGYGMIDAVRAVAKALETAGGVSPPILVANPNSLNFGTSQSSLDLVTTNGGGGSLSITNVSDNAPWLSVNATSVDGNQLGTYTVSVDRSGLGDGIYSATVSFGTNVPNTLVVPVAMQVGTNSGFNDNVGLQWIALINVFNNSTARTVSASGSAGNYSYIFSSVPAGSYYVFGGSDSDNDGFICDDGEACGGYPTINQLTIINLSDNSATDIDFSAGFNIEFGATSLPGSHITDKGISLTVGAQNF